MPVDPQLVELLACPKCHGELDRVATPEGFGCRRCELLYAVDDDLPNMLIEDATHWAPSAVAP